MLVCSLVLDLYLFICFKGNVLLTDVIDELDILADQLEQEAKKTSVYKEELAPGFGTFPTTATRDTGGSLHSPLRCGELAARHHGQQR